MTGPNETEPVEVAPPHAPHEIPGLRAMAIVRWCILIAVALLAAGTWWSLVIHEPAASTEEARFYCPMHPQIRSHDPGTCPICGMRLEPIPRDESPMAGQADPPDAGSPSGEAPADVAPVMLTTERQQLSGIATALVREIPLGGEVRWPAVVEAREGARTEVRLRAEGYVERTRVTESGAQVRRGEVLAWIYAPEVLRAQQELLTAHRWRADGVEPGATDPTATELAARNRLELLGASVADVDAILASGTPRRSLPLRAPASGTITVASAVVGTFASPGDVLYEIVDLARVRVVASVLTASDAAEAPETARLLPRGGGEPIDLTLELVEPAVEGPARATRVRYLAANADGRLRPGAIGDIVVARAARSVLVVPRDAIIDRGASPYVFVDTGEGRFEPRAVEVGALSGEDREIVGGLRVGERVVARGGFVLDSESRLQAALAPRSPPRAHVHGAADGGAP